MTLGSLFDGAGTFPFAAQICGIETLWSSEIEPFPLKVTAKRFPHVKQLGDVTKINGAEIDPVDIITFGSPCQDVSVAGQRKGLNGERSGLFMEAVRIIKEMREKTNGIYPRYAVWENVPGAFSSNKGEDFRTVLEETCKVKDGGAVIPRPAKRKWSDAGEIVADEFSVAWRVLDAQYWGVPQRRRRLFLVGDFGGQRAGEILFEREGLSRDFAESRKTWKGITKSLAFCTDAKVWDARGGGNGLIAPTITGDHQNRVTDYTAIVCLNDQGGAVMDVSVDKTGTLRACVGGHPAIIAYSIQGNCIDRSDTAGCNGKGWTDEAMYTLNTIDRPAVVCIDRAMFNQGQNAQYEPKADESGTCSTIVAKGPCAVCYATSKNDCQTVVFDNCADTLVASDYKDKPCVFAVDCRNGTVNESVNGTLQAKPTGGTSLNLQNVVLVNLILRRITPTECARLQGMPDWWCDDVPHSDSAEYKMWGNGIALPCALYVMEGLANEGV